MIRADWKASMKILGKLRGKHSGWTWLMAGGGMLLAFLGLFVSQAFAAGITVSSATINDGMTVYPTVFEANWTGAPMKVWTLTPNVTAGTVTTVSISGTKSGASKSVRVQLLDASATVLSTGCVVTSGNPFSATIDVVPDVTFSTVARVKALGLTAC